jgi:tetratricopeptide (TPR) repeat protein
MIIAGRYREARDQLHITQELANQFYTDRFFTGRLARTIGWLKLAEKDYPRAEAQFKASIDIYHSITDDEQVSWSQAGLARAYLGQGFADKAREELTDALWTVVEMKAFIPLLFILPVAALLLAQENLKLADEVYHHTQSSPFLSKSQFMRDVIWDYLPLDIKAYPSTIRMDEKKQKEILWEVGSSVLTYWMKFWMEGTEHSEIKRLPDNSLG